MSLLAPFAARSAFRALDDVFARELAPMLRSTVVAAPSHSSSAFFGGGVHGDAFPRLDVRESPAAWEVEADLAGYRRDQLKIAISDNGRTLTLSGDQPDSRPRQAEAADDAGEATTTKSSADVAPVEDQDQNRLASRPTTWLSERYRGHFARSIKFPQPIREADIKAAYADGVLRIDIPKIEPAAPRTIAIN